MSMYQTRHTIINNDGGKEPGSNALKEDADYFKYDGVNGDSGAR